MYEILRKFLGYNFVSGLRTLKTKKMKLKNPIKLKTSKQLGFSRQGTEATF